MPKSTISTIAKALAFLALLFAGGALVFWADDMARTLSEQAEEGSE